MRYRVQIDSVNLLRTELKAKRQAVEHQIDAAETNREKRWLQTEANMIDRVLGYLEICEGELRHMHDRKPL